MSDKTTWLAEARWGVFCHYLTQPQTLADDWNRRVDAFDVHGLARQIKDTGAGYFFITVGQGSGHYCAPNATYDRLTGIHPSKCSQRDLVTDLSDALSRCDIPLLVYAPADGSNADPSARNGLKLSSHWHDKPDFNWQPGPHWAPFRLPEFQRNWEAVCRDWSLRWGAKVRGWWIDGAYARDWRYPENEEPNLRTFAAALRAGNPDALVAFNGGVYAPVIHYSDQDDFTAGEISETYPVCKSPFIEDARGHKSRLHILSYLGEWWGKGPLRFPDEFAAGYTKHVNAKGGVMSWDVPLTDNGAIPDVFFGQLQAIGRTISREGSTR